MANADIPRGFVPVNALGANYCGSANRYFIPATDGTAMAVGDFVRYAGSADADGVATIVRCTASQSTIGAIVGFVADKAYEDDTHRTASTARYALVADDPGQMFMGQVSGSMTAGNIGQNYNLSVGSTDTSNGMSGMQIDSASAGNDAAKVLKLLGIDQRPDNEIGSKTDCIVKINNHIHSGGTGTTGI